MAFPCYTIQPEHKKARAQNVNGEADLDGFLFCLGLENACSLALFMLYLHTDRLHLPGTLLLQCLPKRDNKCNSTRQCNNALSVPLDCMHSGFTVWSVC